MSFHDRIYPTRESSRYQLCICSACLSCVKVAATFTLPNWGYFRGVEAILYKISTKDGLRKGQEMNNNPYESSSYSLYHPWKGLNCKITVSSEGWTNEQVVISKASNIAVTQESVFIVVLIIKKRKDSCTFYVAMHLLSFLFLLSEPHISMGVYIKIVTHYVFKMLICLLFGTCAFCMESRIKSLMEMHTWNTAKTQQGILQNIWMRKNKKIRIEQLKMMSYYKMKMKSIAFYITETIPIIETFLKEL